MNLHRHFPNPFRFSIHHHHRPSESTMVFLDGLRLDISENLRYSIGTCINCREQITDLRLLQGKHFYSSPCGYSHFWCGDCLSDHYKSSLESNEGWFPHCCSIYFSANVVSTIVGRHHDNSEEKATDAPNPKTDKENPENNVFCAKCNDFIPNPNWKLGLARCLGCGLDTCTRCRQPKHEGDCNNVAQSTKLKKLNLLAKKKGWVTCEMCGQILEKIHGCNKIQ
ncbi:hypothetical protein QBC38DRAFT_61070 [Podospora fimiseda]|uniref:RING-type domain-containing protein n=1 Tax=Podospora fimiseda TaxID=252190 RepID=A0AAN6YR87_9PEZI|nr:hypothetical protein QBC38DRAFT_61070 [Podospora fimiseda]